MFNSKKVLKVIALAIVATLAFSTMTAFAAGNITWQVKDYITATGVSGTVGGGLGTGQGGPALVPPYEIVYEQYLDGVSTGLVVSGADARDYGLKGFASSITRPVSWYDLSYPNLQYEEIYADGEYTGLLWATGARLPYTAYKDFRFMWEVGGTHKEVAQTRANFGDGNYYGDATYPIVYTGANADVKEENIYFGFDVFEIYEDGKARDVEVVLDTEGNNVNLTNPVKANEMINAADQNTIYDGDITGLVNSGAGVNSVLYSMLATDGAPVSYRTQFEETDPKFIQVPVYNYTGFESTHFDDVLPITHYFQLTGPTYDNQGAIAERYGLVIDAYEDVVTADAEFDDFIVDIDETGDWDYFVDSERFSYYTNNLITTHITAKATADWVYAGWELAEPYRIYEYLSIEGIVFDGDIDNDGFLDTPVIFRYSGGLADPKVEWKYAWVEASYPHEIYAQKFVEDMNGNMIAVDDFRGVGKYAKENYVANNAETGNVHTTGKHYQGRLEWVSNEGVLYVTDWGFDAHAADFIELSVSPNPSYLGAIDYQAPGSTVVLDPVTVKSVNDID